MRPNRTFVQDNTEGGLPPGSPEAKAAIERVRLELHAPKKLRSQTISDTRKPQRKSCVICKERYMAANTNQRVCFACQELMNGYQ